MRRAAVGGVLVAFMTVLGACGARGSAASGGGGSSGGSAQTQSQAGASSAPSASSKPAASTGKTYQMKIAMATANDIQQQVGNLFAKRLQQASGGRLKVSVYPGSQLGSNSQMNQGVQSGAIEAIIQPTGFMTPFVPQMGVLDLPFLFTSLKQQQRVLASPAMGVLTKDALAKNFVILNYWPYSADLGGLITRVPMRSVSDIKGKKFRIFPSPELIGEFQAWGASAIPMPLTSVYTALQQGTIDGLSDALPLYTSAKLYEVAPYFTYTGQWALSDVIAVSKTWFDGLPSSLQQVVRKTAVGMLPQIYQFAVNDEAHAKSELAKDTKVHIEHMPASQLKIMQADVKSVWQKDQNSSTKGPILSSIEKYLK